MTGLIGIGHAGLRAALATRARELFALPQHL